MTRENLKKFIILLSLFLFITNILPGETSKKRIGAVMAISDGHGNIELMWYPPIGKWPDIGWRILDGKGIVVKKSITPGRKKWMKKLHPDDAKTARKLIEILKSKKNIAQMNKIYAVLAVKEFTIPYFAKAMGLSVSLKKVGKGFRKYRVIGLSRNKRVGISLNSISIDGFKRSSLPEQPKNFKGEPTRNRLALYWDIPVINKKYPVFSHYIERINNSGKRKVLTENFLILSSKRDPKKPSYYDDTPLFEKEIIYKVENIDVFGRHSEPSIFSINIPDPDSKYPPVQKSINIRAEKGNVIISWKPKKNIYTAGYIIERSNSDKGIYKRLTKQYLPVKTDKFIDKNITGGTTYFYRIISVRKDGERGEPSFPMAITAKNSKKPSRINSLSAKAGRTRVRIEWKKGGKVPVSGYLVERRAEKKKWERINKKINQLEYYNDHMDINYYGTFYYRVTAIAFDNQQSQPSRAVKVTIPYKIAPPSPYIDKITGNNSEARITFKPAYPPKISIGFYILRSGNPDEKGVVISGKLTSETRKFTDKFVTPGKTYWYRVVAVGNNNMLSSPSNSTAVSISNGKIPIPKTPLLKKMKTPFIGITISFEIPGKNLSVIVERKSKSEKSWVLILGPTTEREIIDTNPPEHGKILYRIYFQSPTGASGEPSPSVEIKM